MSRRITGEGSVYQRRSDARWSAAGYVTTTEDTHKRKIVYGRTRAEASAKLRELLIREQRGIRTPAREQTVGEYLSYWLTEKAAPRLKPKTVASYESVIRLYLKPGIGHIWLSSLRPADFQRFIHRQEQAGTTPRRIHQCKQVLHRALNVAMRDELVTINAAHSAELPSYHRKPITLWTSEQLRHFIATTTSHPWHLAFLLSAICGMRPGEVAGLQWRDVDLARDLIHLRRQLQRIPHQGLQTTTLKTEAGLRDIPLPLALRSAFLVRQPDVLDDAFVIVSSTGTPLDPKNYYKAFVRAAQDAELPHIALYHLRHGAATMLKDVGTDPKDAQELLGHANISTTQQIYQHGNLDAQRKSLECIAQTVFGDVATQTATHDHYSKGHGTENGALTSGGPDGARTHDTLLKRAARALDKATLTSVRQRLQTRARTAKFGGVAVKSCCQTTRGFDQASQHQLDVEAIEQLILCKLSMATFPYTLINREQS